MQKSERSSYTPLDFAEWKNSGTLLLTPKFQRRSVWKPAARSFFVDTLLRSMPVPPIYIRISQSEKKDKIIREVVDGQQRISAVLAFMEGEFSLSRSLRAGWAGKYFEDLEEHERDSIRSFSFSAEVFHGISDLEVLEIFSRLNTYSVPLNKQELRNGRFFGFFKTSAYSLAYEHLEFWRRHRVFTEQGIARMLEVEFVSEAMIAFMHGMQDKKSSIDGYYEQYDQVFPLRDQIEERFRNVVDLVTSSVGEVLPETEFRRPPLLYSLFCAVYAYRFGLPDFRPQEIRRNLNRETQYSLRVAVEKLSHIVESAKNDEDVPVKFKSFAAACLRQTDNLRPRVTRFETIMEQAFS